MVSMARFVALDRNSLRVMQCIYTHLSQPFLDENRRFNFLVDSSKKSTYFTEICARVCRIKCNVFNKLNRNQHL
jgi:hypothetical protein